MGSVLRQGVAWIGFLFFPEFSSWSRWSYFS
jgi:hypothetical protein